MPSRVQQKHTKQQRQAAATTKQIAAAKKRSNERNGARTARPQAPGSNAKTVSCKYFEKNSRCPYGDKCTYAHGLADLAKRTPRKFKTPCWYFNHGGCSKSAEECAYNHVLDSDMRKPLHLQHPCPFYHHRTPLQCRRGNSCGGDHFYELTANEWKHHFSEVEFPGDNYFEMYGQRSRGSRESFKVEPEDFPILETYQSTPKAAVGGAWGKPLSFKEADDQSVSPVATLSVQFKMEAEDFPVLDTHQSATKAAVGGAWGKPLSFKKAADQPVSPVTTIPKLSEPYDPNKCWVDYSTDEDIEDPPSRSAPPKAWEPGNGWGSDGDEPRDQSQIRDTDEQILKEKIDQLQTRVSQILTKDSTVISRA